MKQLRTSSTVSPFLLLAPANAMVPSVFNQTSRDPDRYSQVLSEMQVMRGAVALAEGAIGPEDLDAQLRYRMPGDLESWHLLRVEEEGRLRGCARILIHPGNAKFSDLRLAESTIAKSPEWKRQIKYAVEADMELGRMCGVTLVEPGGWVLEKNLRGGPDAVEIALSAFAWSQLVGGTLAFITASVKHGSASILKRLGGSLLTFAGTDIPRYYDTRHQCEMELLKIQTRDLDPRFASEIAPLRDALALAPVLQSRKTPSAVTEMAA